MSQLLIKYRLEVWENTVLFQILAQSDKHVCKSNVYTYAFTDCPLSVYSSGNPHLGDDSISLRGRFANKYFSVCTKVFKTHEEALDYKSKAEESIEAWVANGGFAAQVIPTKEVDAQGCITYFH